MDEKDVAEDLKALREELDRLKEQNGELAHHLAEALRDKQKLEKQVNRLNGRIETLRGRLEEQDRLPPRPARLPFNPAPSVPWVPSVGGPSPWHPTPSPNPDHPARRRLRFGPRWETTTTIDCVKGDVKTTCSSATAPSRATLRSAESRLSRLEARFS